MGKTIGQQDVATTLADGDFILFETAGGITKKITKANFQTQVGLAVQTSNGTYVHSNVTTEETVLEITDNVEDTTVSYDVSLLAQLTTIRVKEKMDGTNYEIQSEKVFPTDFDSNIEAVVINLLGKGRDQIITFQSGTVEGATRDIPWSRRDLV